MLPVRAKVPRIGRLPTTNTRLDCAVPLCMATIQSWAPDGSAFVHRMERSLGLCETCWWRFYGSALGLIMRWRRAGRRFSDRVEQVAGLGLIVPSVVNRVIGV